MPELSNDNLTQLNADVAAIQAATSNVQAILATLTPDPVTPPPVDPPVTPPVTPTGTKPTRANTGPRTATTTTVSGNTSANTTGHTYAGVHFTGSVIVNGDNVTLRDCTIDGAINVNDANGLTVDHCRVGGIYTEGFTNLTIDGCFFGDQSDTFAQFSCGTAAHGDGLTISNSLFDGLTASTGTDHKQAMHLMGVSNFKASNTVFSYVPPTSGTRSQVSAAVFHEGEFQGRNVTNWTYDGCWFAGGGYYQAYFIGSGGTITNCAFDDSWGGSIAYPHTGQPATQSGNTLDGKPYTIPTA